MHPSGWQLFATIGFHYVAPWATVIGRLFFGPRPRLVDWYPYPFLDVQKIGYLPAFGSTLGDGQNYPLPAVGRLRSVAEVTASLLRCRSFASRAEAC